MSNIITQQPLVWQEDKIKKLSLELARELSRSVKEGNWYNYHLRFKKENKSGEVIISDPSVIEIQLIEKFINKP